MLHNSYQTKCLTIISGSLVSSVLLSSMFLTTSLVSADDSAVDNININVPVSCNITSTGNDSHTATIENGRNVTDIGTTTIKVFCNDNSGFAIYAAGYTGEAIGGTDSNKLVSSNSALSSNSIVTGTNTSGNTSNWSMKLTKVENEQGEDPVAYNPANLNILSDTEGSFSNYHTVPNEYTKVATFSSSTDVTLGSVLRTTYQVYISPTQPASSYSGKVIYTLVHPSGAPAPTISLCASNQLVMQDVSEWGSSVTSSSEVTACDARDGKTYTVARLADDNLWMTQNLDHDIKTDGTVTYDSTTTDLPANATWTPERATYATGTTTWGLYNPSTGELDGTTHPESYDPGDYYWNGTLSNHSDWDVYYNSCTYNDDTWMYENCDESLNPTNTYISNTSNNSHYHLGNYYNWTAAIATNTSSSYTTDGATINQSICPAGWTLPKGGSLVSSPASGSFQDLVESYGWNSNTYQLGNNAKIYNSPLYMPLGGHWYGMLVDVGFAGAFWSSVVKDSKSAYSLYADSDGYVVPGSLDVRRGYGNFVRCVAR